MNVDDVLVTEPPVKPDNQLWDSRNKTYGDAAV